MKFIQTYPGYTPPECHTPHLLHGERFAWESGANAWGHLHAAGPWTREFQKWCPPHPPIAVRARLGESLGGSSDCRKSMPWPPRHLPSWIALRLWPCSNFRVHLQHFQRNYIRSALRAMRLVSSSWFLDANRQIPTWNLLWAHCWCQFACPLPKEWRRCQHDPCAKCPPPIPFGNSSPFGIEWLWGTWHRMPQPVGLGKAEHLQNMIHIVWCYNKSRWGFPSFFMFIHILPSISTKPGGKLVKNVKISVTVCYCMLLIVIAIIYSDVYICIHI